MGAPDDDATGRFRTDLLVWAEDNVRDFPWRRDDASPYEVLVSEMLLNVTRTEVVAGVVDEFFVTYPDAETLREADRDELVDIIRPLGLYNRRADALLELAEIIAETGVPDTREELLELPRVGRYVANAVLSMAFGQADPMLDRNAARTFSRVFGEEMNVEAPSVDDWEFAAEMVPEGKAKLWNMALLDFASAVCKAPTPDCERCFATEYCRYYSEEMSDEEDTDP